MTTNGANTGWLRRWWDAIDPLAEAARDNAVYQAFLTRRTYRGDFRQRLVRSLQLGARVGGAAAILTKPASQRPRTWKWVISPRTWYARLCTATAGNLRDLQPTMPSSVQWVFGIASVRALPAEDLWRAGATGSHVIWAMHLEFRDSLVGVGPFLANFLTLWFFLGALGFWGARWQARLEEVPFSASIPGLLLYYAAVATLAAVLLMIRNHGGVPSPRAQLAKHPRVLHWRLAALSTLDPDWALAQAPGHPARDAWEDHVRESNHHLLRVFGGLFVLVTLPISLLVLAALVGRFLTIPDNLGWLVQGALALIRHLGEVIILVLLIRLGGSLRHGRPGSPPVPQATLPSEPEADRVFDLYMRTVVMEDPDAWESGKSEK